MYLLPNSFDALLTFIYMLSISTREWKSQSNTYLPRESKHLSIYLSRERERERGLQGDVHSIWDLWTSGLQECKGNFLGELDEVGSICQSGSSSLYYYYYYYYYWGGLLDCGPQPWHPFLTWWGHGSASWGPSKWHELQP